VHAGVEGCDDGNSSNTDACLVTCTAASCGDGFVNAGVETCDDANASNTDACLNTCAAATCGDGFVLTGLERCDDGNSNNTDGCSSSCVVVQVCNASNPLLVGGDRFAGDANSGDCYVSFDDEVTTFAAASNACAASGGHLVTVNNATEQALVAAVQNPAQTPWIGGTDATTEGVFAWLTGETFGFSNFMPGQPDNGGGVIEQDCLQLVSNGEWNDIACDDAGVVGRICEIRTNACGDGVTQASRGETCDDGNGTAFDGCNAVCRAETLFFSEYVEGSSTNKAVEIANPFNTPVNLTGCSLRLYSNGAITPTSLALTQTIAAHDVFVACTASVGTAIGANCDLINASVINFNGDDVVELQCGGVTIDAIGRVGEAPAQGWGTGGVTTLNHTLRRKCAFTIGDNNRTDAFDPTIEWGGFAVDTFGDLGAYTCAP